MADLCLGTVQFGLKYGIHNTLGQPSVEDSMEMIDFAIQNGIQYIDTARAYGTAELVLGRYIQEKGVPADIHFISKLRPNVIPADCNDVQGVVREELESTFERTHLKHLDGYLLHTPEYIYNESILKALEALKKEKLVSNIGVSIYDLKEGYEAIRTGIVDYIQLPYSILDQRGIREGFIQKAKQSGITIFTRSAFLQGLLMMEKNKIPDHLKQSIPDIDKFYSIVEEYQEDPVKTMIHFVTEEEDIDYLVFGVDTKDQLRSDITTFHDKKLPEEMVKRIKNEISNLDRNIIFPSLWSNGKKAQ